MDINNLTDTTEVMRQIGHRLRSTRIATNMSHQEVAAAAGLGVATLVRAEAGRNTSLASVIRILRALGRLDAIDGFLAVPVESPIQLLKHGGKVRQRVRKPKATDPDADG